MRVRLTTDLPYPEAYVDLIPITSAIDGSGPVWAVELRAPGPTQLGKAEAETLAYALLGFAKVMAS